MPKTRVGDIEMYYERHGDSGTPLVHIGGLAGDARAWQRQIKHLAQRHCVLAFDNRGTGRSDCPDEPYSIAQFARDTFGLMDVVGFEAAHVVGISMGGAIAQEMACRHPERVLSLIVNCSFAKMDRYANRIVETVMNVYQAQGAMEAAKAFVLFFYTLPYFNAHADEVSAKEQVLGDNDRPGHAYLASSRACTEFDGRGQLGQIKCPVLVNAGAEDLLCSPGCSQEIADAIDGARLKIYPDASHFFLNEYYDEVMADFDAFLGEVEPGLPQAGLTKAG